MARYQHTSGRVASAPDGSKRDALMRADAETWTPLDKPKAKAKAEPKAEPTKGSGKS